MNIKKSYFLPLCLSAVIFCGCSQTEKNETTSAAETTASFETTARTTVTTVQTTAETTVTTASPKKDLTQEQKQIQALLSEAKLFFYDYVYGKEIQNHADWTDYISELQPGNEFTDWEEYESKKYKVIGGDVTTKTAFENKMKPIFTEEMIGTVYSFPTVKDSYYFDDNGDLFISDGVGSNVGCLGTDTVYITSIEKADENTFIINMTAFGAGKNWNLDYDTSENFNVKVKRTEDGFKLCECDFDSCSYIAWCYNPEDDIFE